MKSSLQLKINGLILEGLDEQHLASTLEWRNSDQVRKWFKSTDLISWDQHKSWYEKYRINGNDIHFVARHVSSNFLAGQVAIYDIDRETRSAQIGRISANPAYQGRGHIRSACQVILEFGFTVLDLQRIYLEVFVTNDRAVALYSSLGFEVVPSVDQLLRMQLIKPT